MSLSLAVSVPYTWSSDKKVYADYHGVRTTRELNAGFNLWQYASLTTGTANGPKSLAYNPDIILETGRHDIAAANYPVVDMQSQFDPAYLEYQILSAKAAGIDGFWIEWGYIDHPSNTLLKTMQPIAAKYDFEIGVNWCDAWLFTQTWVTSSRPEITTREDKLQYFKECLQYLIDDVFTGPTAPRVNGMPVFYLFGGGILPEELQWIENQEYNLPEGTAFPAILRRISPPGRITGGNYVPGSPLAAASAWSATGIIPAAWMPERLRPGTPTSAFPTYDYYALGADAAAYLGGFNTEIWSDPAVQVKSGFAAPGMDNIGCGGWSDADARFYIIPRNNGDTYRGMWQYNVDNRDKLHMVYIASWSDYTEGHEIEPTVQNGDRELRTTLQYAAQFKEISGIDESGISLPPGLFEQRKRLEFLATFGINTTALNGKLDEVALSIAAGSYAAASASLNQAIAEIDAIETQVTRTDFTVPSSALKIAGSYTSPSAGEYELDGSRFGIGLPADAWATLTDDNYTAYLNFEYFDSGRTDINIAQKRRDGLPTDYNIAARIKQDNKQAWRKVRIQLYPRNMLLNGTEWGSQQTDISFYGRTRIRNISFEFSTYEYDDGGATSIMPDAMEDDERVGKTNSPALGELENIKRLTVYNPAGERLFTAATLSELNSLLGSLRNCLSIIVAETADKVYTYKQKH